jgi:hypothetical protein
MSQPELVQGAAMRWALKLLEAGQHITIKELSGFGMFVGSPYAPLGMVFCQAKDLPTHIDMYKMIGKDPKSFAAVLQHVGRYLPQEIL